MKHDFPSQQWRVTLTTTEEQHGAQFSRTLYKQALSLSLLSLTPCHSILWFSTNLHSVYVYVTLRYNDYDEEDYYYIRINFSRSVFVETEEGKSPYVGDVKSSSRFEGVKKCAKGEIIRLGLLQSPFFITLDAISSADTCAFAR